MTSDETRLLLYMYLPTKKTKKKKMMKSGNKIFQPNQDAYINTNRLIMKKMMGEFVAHRSASFTHGLYPIHAYFLFIMTRLQTSICVRERHPSSFHFNSSGLWSVDQHLLLERSIARTHRVMSTCPNSDLCRYVLAFRGHY